jgi:DNA-binding NtrC family response regulator
MTIQKKRLLFVDDEVEMLSALRNVLHKERKRWEMVFTSSGELALEELRKAPFDMVVSDMRMPGIDGAALLTQVMVEFPSTARIMLSGYAERRAFLAALPALHHFLSKPCDAVTLRSTIERCLEEHARPYLAVESG